MRLTQDEVEKVAKLANLEITERESEHYSQELSSILAYIEKMARVDTTEVEACFNVSDKQTVVRADQAVSSLNQDEATANAKSVENGLFVTKGIFVEE